MFSEIAVEGNEEQSQSTDVLIANWKKKFPQRIAVLRRNKGEDSVKVETYLNTFTKELSHPLGLTLVSRFLNIFNK